MGSITVIKGQSSLCCPHLFAAALSINLSNIKNSEKLLGSQESNPGPLGAEHELYLLCFAPPLPPSIRLKNSRLSLNCSDNISALGISASNIWMNLHFFFIFGQNFFLQFQSRLCHKNKSIKIVVGFQTTQSF